MNFDHEIKELENQIHSIKKYLADNPYRNIEFSRTGQHHYLYLYKGTCGGSDTRTKEYIPVGSHMFRKLINAKYYRKLLPILEKELKYYEDFKKRCEPTKKFQVLDCIPREYQSMLDMPIKSPEAILQEWASKTFDSNPYPFADDSTIITRNGERVRSKAEYIIANLLNDMGLSYRYECELVINGRTVYPDFTIMHPLTGELYYLEYFGMMDNEKYLPSALKKISFYQQTDFPENFIYIFESNLAPMNIQSIRKLLEHIFLSDKSH